MLTEKQERFCQNIIAGMTNKDAYITAYNSSGSDQNAWNESGKLLAREDIQERLKILRQPLEEHARTTALTEREKKKAIIWEGIEACRISGDHSGVARYMDILNKMDAEYININKTIEDKTADIKELDKSVLEKLVMSS